MESSSAMIEIDGLSKMYYIGGRQSYRTFREALVDAALAPIRRIREAGQSSIREENAVWALRDVSFKIAQGEVVGLIGRNGAGKSTLLKMLSRVTEPTQGRAVLRGRVGSLLEVGTGFHPELTGRENIFLSGAILGMTRREIQAKFDQIVDFAGIGKFIDTPVKRYSSGMPVRLGFAVAAHLEPEILLVDEVLAVGDAEFQRKCLGKMSEVSRGGRTVVFVSHNMSAIVNLCRTAVLLEGGRMTYYGSAHGAMEKYLGLIAGNQADVVDLREHRGRVAGSKGVMKAVSMRGANGRGLTSVFRTGEDVLIDIDYDTQDASLNHVFVGIHTSLGERICSVGTHLDPQFRKTLTGRGRIECRLPAMCLAAGDYSLMLAMGNKPGANVDCVEDAMRFRVELADFYGTGESLARGQGYLAQKCHFRADSEGDA